MHITISCLKIQYMIIPIKSIRLKKLDLKLQEAYVLVTNIQNLGGILLMKDHLVLLIDQM